MPGKMELSDDMGGDKKYVVSGGLKKPVSCKVLMLDGTESSFDVEVCCHLVFMVSLYNLKHMLEISDLNNN